MESRSVFDYLDYRAYLSKRLSTSGESRGMRHKFAQALQVGDSYVTKVLKGIIDLSLDNVPVVDQLLEHNDDEAEFFLQLVLYTQSESDRFKNVIKKKLDGILAKRRLKPYWFSEMEEYPDHIEPIYFSSWYYIVIHFLTSVPDFQTNVAIAKRLKLPLGAVNEVLDFLTKAGILEKNGDRYQNVKLRTYQPSSSVWVNHAHMNLRHLAMQKSAEKNAENLHYSGVYSISLKDSELMKTKIRQLLKEFEMMATKRINEDTFGFGIDFFKV